MESVLVFVQLDGSSVTALGAITPAMTPGTLVRVRAVSANQMRIELTTRILAEGMKKLFKLIGDRLGSFSATSNPQPIEHALDQIHILALDVPQQCELAPAQGGLG